MSEPTEPARSQRGEGRVIRPLFAAGFVTAFGAHTRQPVGTGDEVEPTRGGPFAPGRATPHLTLGRPRRTPRSTPSASSLTTPVATTPGTAPSPRGHRGLHPHRMCQLDDLSPRWSARLA